MQQAAYLLTACLGCSSTLKMDAVHFSKILVNYQNTWCHISVMTKTLCDFLIFTMHAAIPNSLTDHPYSVLGFNTFYLYISYFKI
jgi:hypothetical protein